jgi:peptide chain release factor subunit 1
VVHGGVEVAAGPLGAGRIENARVGYAPDVTELDTDLATSLASFRAEHASAISCYLGLDPANVPTAGALASHVTSLVDAAERAAERVTDALEHNAAKQLKEDVARIDAFLENDLDRSETQGLALFVSGTDETWQEVRLPRPVADAVHIGRTFVLAPLLDFLEHDRRMILAAVGRDRGQLWSLRRGIVSDLDDLTRDGQGQHDQGGWSQARYQRARDKEAVDHMRAVAEAISNHIPQGSDTLLVLAGAEEQRSAFAQLLEPHVRGALIGWTDVEKQEDGDALRPEAERLLNERLEVERNALLDRWREEHGQRSGRAALTWDETMAAALEGRIDSLLVDGRSGNAFECTSCGRGYVNPGTCELDSTPLAEALGGALEVVLRGTLQNGGTVRLVHGEELTETDGAAALLRYAVVPAG